MNLIVTCARNLEGETEEEILDILDELGDPDVKISVSNMSGIITIETKLDPIEVVRKMKEMLLDEPWSIRYCLRVIPIQKTVETNLEKIQECVSSISNNIEENESDYQGDSIKGYFAFLTLHSQITISRWRYAAQLDAGCDTFNSCCLSIKK